MRGYYSFENTELELKHAKNDYDLQYGIFNYPNYNKNFDSDDQKPVIEILSINKNRTFTIQNINGLIWDTPISNILVI